jgi:hypothetical protein
MHSEVSERTLLFVTGAPRSGTTFVSDWISQTDEAYVCHEILAHLEGLTFSEMWAYLEQCAQTNIDRMQKPKQLEFMAWSEQHREVIPRVLGLKEPVTWSSDEPPNPLPELLTRGQSRCIVLIRHPYDVVISGARRGRETRNWPGYSVGEHCRLWLQTLTLVNWLRNAGLKVLIVRWEDLVIAHGTVKDSIERFIGFQLPIFMGFERVPTDLELYVRTVSRTYGICDARRRSELSDSDREQVRAIVASQAEELEYCLDDPMAERLT